MNTRSRGEWKAKTAIIFYGCVNGCGRTGTQIAWLFIIPDTTTLVVGGLSPGFSSITFPHFLQKDRNAVESHVTEPRERFRGTERFQHQRLRNFDENCSEGKADGRRVAEQTSWYPRCFLFFNEIAVQVPRRIRQPCTGTVNANARLSCSACIYLDF